MPDVQTVSIIGTGDGVTREASGAIAQTPAGQPDLRLNVVRPIVAILVRFVHVFLTSFVGVLTAAGIGGADIIGTSDFQGVVRNGAWLALSVAGMGFGKDLITIFGRLENKFPLMTGSI